MAAAVAMVIVGAQGGGHDGGAHGSVKDQDLFALAPGQVGFAAAGHASVSALDQRLPANTASSRALAARPCPMVKTWMPGTP